MKTHWVNGQLLLTRGEFEIHLKGGLGDVFLDYYGTGASEVVEGMDSSQRAKIKLYSHNPFCHEIWAWQPPERQIEVWKSEHWFDASDDDAADRELRTFYHRPNPDTDPESIRIPGSITFYPRNEDEEVLNIVRENAKGGRPIIVLAASAGGVNRNIPQAFLDAAVARFASRYLIVTVGRTYQHKGTRVEMPAPAGTLDTIDRLTVPGVGKLLQMADGLITCHSSMNLLGWLLGVPELLVSPMGVYQKFFEPLTKWGFGMRQNKTIIKISDSTDGTAGVLESFQRVMQ